MRTDLSIVQGIKFSVFIRMFLYLNYIVMHKNVNYNEKCKIKKDFEEHITPQHWILT